ncbi:MAG: phosphatase PAP2 family protein [Candidatus Aenigmarchaeota archaeon]|nr:phosphatase PAP2 family protein [Candidatus Aenigmarchaeota archaeon]
MTFHLNPWFLVTLLGEPDLWLVIAVGLGVFSLVWRRLRPNHRLHVVLEVLILSLLIVLGIVFATKQVTQIDRPCGPENPYCLEDSSFPSGHAASIFAAFTVLLAFLPRRWLPLLAVPLLVAASRVALGVHTWLDVAAGAVLGILVALGVIASFRKAGRLQKWPWER